jgi:hypothetical protein
MTLLLPNDFYARNSGEAVISPRRTESSGSGRNGFQVESKAPDFIRA